MQIKLSNETVKRSLASHGAIGLTVGALLYLVCLTGTLAVLMHEIERWQQPGIDEFTDYNANMIENSVAQYTQKADTLPASLYVILPTDDLPRMHISDTDQEWYTDQQGNLTAPPEEGWLGLLLDMHIHLHMGETIGLVVVSCLAVMLVALIISGVMAHPKMFKEAFRLRLGGSRRLEQVDIHNRLSVWGLPFHLMMGITGAFFGLVGIMGWLAAAAFFDGDRDAMIDHVYGGDPVINAPVEPMNYEAALNHLAVHEPNANPIYLVLHKLGTEQQFMEIAATLPGRFVYSEMYRYQANGDFINHQQLSDGPIGRQLAYSVYRIHFGQFGGVWVKVAYVLLGLALTVVSVTGINIWLARTQPRSWIPNAWTGIVWGAPIGLCLAALLSVLLNITSLWEFFLGLIAAIVVSLMINNQQISRTLLMQSLSAMLLFLVMGYAIKYPSHALQGASLYINGLLLLTSVILALMSSKESKEAAGNHFPQRDSQHSSVKP